MSEQIFHFDAAQWEKLKTVTMHEIEKSLFVLTLHFAKIKQVILVL